MVNVAHLPGFFHLLYCSTGALAVLCKAQAAKEDPMALAEEFLQLAVMLAQHPLQVGDGAAGAVLGQGMAVLVRLQVHVTEVGQAGDTGAGGCQPASPIADITGYVSFLCHQ